MKENETAHQLEQERVQRLHSYNILDSLPEQDYDDLVLIAAQICSTPIALVSLVDSDRQWFKARIGLDAQETPRAIAFCHHAVQRPDEVFIVEDAEKDPRFRDNPLVTGHPDIRFYAGSPITTADGYGLGTLCVIDTRPRELDENARAALQALSRQVMRLLDLRLDRHLLEERSLEVQRQSSIVSSVFHSVGQGLLTFLSNGSIQKANPAALRMFDQQDLHGWNVSDLFREPASADALISRALTSETDLEWSGLRSGRTEFPAQLSVTPLDDQTLGYLAVIRDLTRTRQADEARELQQRRMRRLYEITSRIQDSLEHTLDELLAEGTKMLGHGLGIISRIEKESYSVEHFFPPESGLAKGQVFDFGQTYCEITYDQDGVLAIDNMGASEFSTHPCYAAFQLESYVGVPLFVRGERYGTLNFSSNQPRDNRYPGLDEDYVQAMGHWVGAAIERTQAEERARRLSAILEAAPQLVGMADAKTGRPLYVNGGGRRLLGIGLDESLHASIDDVHPPAAIDTMRKESLPTAIERGHWTGESALLHKDGTEIPVLQVLICHKDSDGEPVYFSTICQDIRKLKEVERMKSEFISTVSHELRTPLTSIRGSLGLLAGGALGQLPEKAKGLIQLAANNTDRLVRLINDILDMEKIESGSMDYRFQRVDVSALIEEAIRQNSEFAAKHDTRFEARIETPHTTVVADPDRLRQVIDNLMSNAAKFTRPGTPVIVGLEERNSMLRIGVRDHGEGIPEDFQSKLFEKFTQSDSSSVRAKGGTGLGLAISQSIVLAHASRLQFSTEAGVGSTFYFDLRLAEAGSPEAVGDPTGRRILVVEDNPDIGRLLVMMLSQAGHVARLAINAAEARQRLASEKYDAMTLDINLPDSDGLSLLADLRTTEAGRDLPVIVVSARSQPGGDELEGRALRIHDWIAKPIDENRLLRAIEATSYRTGRPQILHVEDDADFSRVIAMTLEDLADVQNVSNKADAMNELQARSYDLVLLDLGLPDGAADDLIPRIHALASPPTIVVLTGQDRGPEISRRVHAMLEKSRTSGTGLVQQITALLGLQPHKDDNQAEAPGGARTDHR